MYPLAAGVVIFSEFFVIGVGAGKFQVYKGASPFEEGSKIWEELKILIPCVRTW